MTIEYVIRSEFNMFPPNTTNWITDHWVCELDKAKIFESLNEAVAGLDKLSIHLKNTGCPFHNYTIHEVRKVNALGDKVNLVDDKDTVLSLLNSLTKWGVRDCDVPDMLRIINYVKET